MFASPPIEPNWMFGPSISESRTVFRTAGGPADDSPARNARTATTALKTATPRPITPTSAPTTLPTLISPTQATFQHHATHDQHHDAEHHEQPQAHPTIHVPVIAPTWTHRSAVGNSGYSDPVLQNPALGNQGVPLAAARCARRFGNVGRIRNSTNQQVSAPRQRPGETCVPELQAEATTRCSWVTYWAGASASDRLFPSGSSTTTWRTPLP